MTASPRVLFVNSGILGLISFHHFLQKTLPTQRIIRGEHILLTEGLTLSVRIVRRLLALRLWKDGMFGLSNLDLLRFRMELFTGLHARRRMSACGVSSFDVLHFHRQAAAYGSLDLLKQIPSIVSLDCTQECVAGPASRLERLTYEPNLRIDGAIFRRAVALIATSQWAADSVRRYYPDCQTPIHVMPNPVAIDLFDVRWLAARRRRRAGDGRPRLLFVGGDFPRKGGYELLEAWEYGGFRDRATLALVTDWPIDRVPAGVTVHRGVRPHTRQWAEHWAAADAFVMPTRNEAFGLVYQEAAAAGLPAIGTRHNAVPEIILDEETGVLVDVGDRAQLAGAMQQLVESPDLRERLGRRAREVIEQVANPERYLSQLTAIILDAAQKHE